MGVLARWITVFKWLHAQILIPFHADPGVVRMLQWVQGQMCRALLPPYFWGRGGGDREAGFFLALISIAAALPLRSEQVEVCWAAELVVLSPGHSHLGISTLVNVTAVLRDLCPLLVSEYFKCC